MIRESDEECLALIATIRDRGRLPPMRAETDRLLDNLEARIEEGVHPDCLREKDRLVQENLRLRGQLAELGTEFVKLTGEIDRLHTECEEKEIVLSCSSLRAPKDAEPERRVHLTEDCPCGTEACREAWRELRQAKAEWVIKPEGQEKPASAQVGRDAEQGAIRFRDIIREEALAAVSAVWKDAVRHEIAGPILERRIGEVGLKDVIREEVRKEVESYGSAEACRQHVREEVAAEVARQLGEWQEAKASPEIRTWLDNVQHELDKLRVALEAEAS